MLDADVGRAELTAVSPSDESTLAILTPVRRVEPSLEILHLPDHELVVVSKRRPGCDTHLIQSIRNLIRDIVTGQCGPCKFIVLDFTHEPRDDARPGSHFEELIGEVSDLIFDAPVVSIAWVRKGIAGADLELALACTMIVSEEDATFSFGIDLVDCLRSYALLAHKIGFVQAERLMEAGEVVGAETMRELMLVQSVVPRTPGLDSIETFVKARTRRHNSTCGLYRAQRIAMLGA